MRQKMRIKRWFLARGETDDSYTHLLLRPLLQPPPRICPPNVPRRLLLVCCSQDGDAAPDLWKGQHESAPCPCGCGSKACTKNGHLGVHVKATAVLLSHAHVNPPQEHPEKALNIISIESKDTKTTCSVSEQDILSSLRPLAEGHGRKSTRVWDDAPGFLGLNMEQGGKNDL